MINHASVCVPSFLFFPFFQLSQRRGEFCNNEKSDGRMSLPTPETHKWLIDILENAITRTRDFYTLRDGGDGGGTSFVRFHHTRRDLQIHALILFSRLFTFRTTGRAASERADEGEIANAKRARGLTKHAWLVINNRRVPSKRRGVRRISCCFVLLFVKRATNRGTLAEKYTQK